MSAIRSDHSSLGKMAKSTVRTTWLAMSRYMPCRSMQATTRLVLLKIITYTFSLKVAMNISEKSSTLNIDGGI